MPYLTPDLSVLSESPDCRKIAVSGDLWLYVSGALNYLSQSWNWEMHGSATPEQMADYFKDVLDDYVMSSCGGGMQYLFPVSQIVNANDGGGITVWSIPLASLPLGATGVLLGVQINATGNGTLQGGAIRNGIGLGGASIVSWETTDSFFQFTCPVGEQGIRLIMTGGGGTWSIVANVLAYW